MPKPLCFFQFGDNVVKQKGLVSLAQAVRLAQPENCEVRLEMWDHVKQG